MRVKVIGECDSAKALRGYLRMAGVCVTEFLPPDAANFVFRVEQGPQPWIVCDSIPCEFEKNVLEILHEFLGKLPAKPDVQLRRAGGKVRSDRELLLIVPENDPLQQDAAERAAYLGLLRTTHWGEPAAPPPRVEQPKKKWWRWLFPALLLIVPAARSGQSLATAPEKVPPLSVDLPLDASDRMSIRDLQVQQDALIIKRDQLDVQRLELTAKIRDLDDQMKTIAFQSAQANGIDVKKYLIDFGKLVWVLTASEKKP